MTATGLQLVYTNVEADRSPTRQRGFQVWLHTPDLPAELKRAAAKRVDDFRLPPGVRPDDPAAVRHTFARLDGHALVARTVPLADRDKFGRGGKFHAHAVLLTDEAFRGLDADPFRIIDGFAFQSHPDEVGDGWRDGALGPAVVTPGSGGTGLPACVAQAGRPVPPEPAELPPERVRELLAHLDRGDGRPLVLPAAPGRVLAVLRGLFRLLPPAVRAKLTFDTLSAGASLAGTPYAAAGAWSAEALKLWSFRKYVRLDPATGDTLPKLNPSTGLPGALLTADGWAELSGPERDAAFATARALAAGRPDELRPDMLTPAGRTVLTAADGFAAAVQVAADGRAGEVPAALAAVPAVRQALADHFDAPPADALDRLARPVPREVVARPLYEALAREAAPPAPEVLAALGEWAAAGPTPSRLQLILCRWRGNAPDLAAVERFLAVPGPDEARAGWFRGWLAGTLAGVTAGDLFDRLTAADPPRPADLRDARLWLARHPDPESATGCVLKLVVTLAADPAALPAVVRGLWRSSGVERWLVRAAADRLRDKAAAGWAHDGHGDTLVGLFLTPDPAAVALLEAVAGLGPAAPVWPLLDQLRPPHRPPAEPPGATDPPPPAEGVRLLQLVLVAADDERAAAVGRLRAYLAGADDEAYRAVANVLFQQVYGEPTARRLDGGVYFLGLRLAWVQRANPGGRLGLFEAVAGAVAPEQTADAAPAGGPPTPTAARRFGWLLARLDRPAATGRLRI